jgi:putative ABC transport system permease protein
MGVGSGAVLFLIGLGYGFQNLLLANIVNNDTLLSLTINSTQPDVIFINDKVLNEIQEVEGVQDVSPLASYSAQLVSDDLIANVVLKGVDENYLKYEGVDIKIGEQTDQDNREILVSESAVMLFGDEKEKDIIGKEVFIEIFSSLAEGEGEVEKTIRFDQKYKIVGVVKGLDSVFIFFPLEDLKSKIDVLKYETTKVRVSKEENISSVTDFLIEKGFYVSSLSETVAQANKIFRGIQIALGFFGAIALFVAAIGMINTMTVTLLERTNEIGIMRATGASRKDILFLFISESTVMGFLGGVSGLIIGVLGGKLFNWVINMLAGMFGGQSVNLFFYPLWFILTLVIVSTSVGFIAGLIPGRKAAKLDPLDALRYK